MLVFEVGDQLMPFFRRLGKWAFIFFFQLGDSSFGASEALIVCVVLCHDVRLALQEMEKIIVSRILWDVGALAYR